MQLLHVEFLKILSLIEGIYCFFFSSEFLFYMKCHMNTIILDER